VRGYVARGGSITADRGGLYPRRYERVDFVGEQPSVDGG
jgi:hypothetical protein